MTVAWRVVSMVEKTVFHLVGEMGYWKASNLAEK